MRSWYLPQPQLLLPPPKKNIKYQWPINNKQKKQCSTYETSKPTKIKTTMGFPLTQVRTAVQSKQVRTKTSNVWWSGQGAPYTHRWECKFVQTLWKSVWIFLTPIIMELPYNSHPTSGYTAEGIPSTYYKETCTSMFITVTQMSRVTFSRRMDKDMIHAQWNSIWS